MNYEKYSDEQLIQAAVQGKTDAFATLYERYAVLMFRFFYRMLGQNRELANDFTQDIFLKIIEKKHLFDTTKKFKSWLYTIAHNQCKNFYRDRKIVENIDNEDFATEENWDERLDDEMYQEELAKAIERLSPSHRACFVLRFLEDLSVKEIAQIVEIPEGTVKSRIFFATKQIASEIRKVMT